MPFQLNCCSCFLFYYYYYCYYNLRSKYPDVKRALALSILTAIFQVNLG